MICRGIAGENHRAGIRRQAEKKRDLDVGKVLDLIADHEIPRRCSRRLPLVRSLTAPGLSTAQRRAGQVDLVPPARALQPLLVELGHGMNGGAVVAKVRRALAAQGKVVVQRQQGT